MLPRLTSFRAFSHEKGDRQGAKNLKGQSANPASAAALQLMYIIYFTFVVVYTML